MENHEEELIKRRAYAIWEQEGRPDGQHLRHWEQAFREMQKRSAPDESLGNGGARPSKRSPSPRRKTAKNGAGSQ
ncbi:Cell division protein FtsW (plasmid) [Sinorhizobium sojae CCBAU 05684]|uniref:Cell division protein FtsW n=1 Tax=Sinorhizobium sojae CCBAU 05684 TaxID=716928 RepID=A0A249PHY7_9HYPH|nr:Cell division protein FtsW [Sinorhizobium sojae CCBAU 05684]